MDHNLIFTTQILITFTNLKRSPVDANNLRNKDGRSWQLKFSLVHVCSKFVYVTCANLFNCVHALKTSCFQYLGRPISFTTCANGSLNIFPSFCNLNSALTNFIVSESSLNGFWSGLPHGKWNWATGSLGANTLVKVLMDFSGDGDTIGDCDVGDLLLVMIKY